VAWGWISVYNENVQTRSGIHFPPVCFILVATFQVMKPFFCEADNSPPPKAEIKTEWIYFSILPYVITA
jgi:hypothetical protein